MRTKKVNTTGQEINVKDVCKLISIFKPKKNNWMLSYTRPSFCIDDMIEQKSLPTNANKMSSAASSKHY